MYIFYYIIVSMLLALLIMGAAFAVFKAGEKDLICKYGQDETNNDTKRTI